jgi:PAS domain S-box-containing protein
MGGLKMMMEIKKRSPDTECIVLTGHASQASAIEAVNLGAYGYMQKPYDMEQLVVTIHRAIEKRRAEEVLRESEERYHTLFDGVPVGLYRATPDGQNIDANPAAVQMLGYPDLKSLQAANVADLYVDPKERNRWQALMEQEGVVLDFETQLRRHDGTTIWVRDSARAVRDADGRILYYEGSLEDITERKRAEEEISRRSTYLATLLRINATLRGTLPLSQVLEMIVQGAAEALGYVGSFIAIPDATGERLTLGAAWGGRVVDAALKITRFKLESFSVPVKAQENIIARAFVTGEPKPRAESLRAWLWAPSRPSVPKWPRS